MIKFKLPADLACPNVTLTLEHEASGHVILRGNEAPLLRITKNGELYRFNGKEIELMGFKLNGEGEIRLQT